MLKSTPIIMVNQTSANIPSNGAFWQSQVAFYDADQVFNMYNFWMIDNTCLILEMQKLIDTRETIISIGVYKCPLNPWQKVQLLDCHQFVVLQTANWWYSIEKNTQFIFIQRSNNFHNVTCFIKGNCRNIPILQMSVDSGRKTMGELIEFLYNNDELNKGYNSVTSNCHAFAKTIFDQFATNKKHDIIWGCSPTIKIGSPTTSRNELFHWFLKQYITGYNNVLIPE